MPKQSEGRGKKDQLKHRAEKMSKDRLDVEVVIVGAGIAGLAAALAMKKVGIKSIVVLESAAALRSTGAALGLFPNAWRALDVLGIAHKLTPLYSPFRKYSSLFLSLSPLYNPPHLTHSLTHSLNVVIT